MTGKKIMDNEGASEMINVEWTEVPQHIAWVRERTIVRCYRDDTEIADFDGLTGLIFLLREEDGKYFITPDTRIFPECRWVFDGTYQTGGDKTPMETSFIHLEGTADGKYFSKDYLRARYAEDIPWEYDNSRALYTPYAEREDRMEVCRSCVFYEHLTGQCSIDLSFMPEKTKNAQEVCPENKWQESSNFDQEEYERRQAISPPTPPLDEDQKIFEKEWDERNAR